MQSNRRANYKLDGPEGETIVNRLNLPWLEVAILLPLLSSIFVYFTVLPERKRFISLLAASATVLICLGAWIDFELLATYEAQDQWGDLLAFLGCEKLVIDKLNAPLLSLTSFLHFLTFLATPRVKFGRYSFTNGLVLLALTLAILSTREAWFLIAVLVLQPLPILLELRKSGERIGMFALNMALFACLLVLGQVIYQKTSSTTWHGIAISLWIIAVLLRSGCFPIHFWLRDLFNKSTLGSSILFVTPLIGAYAAMRLIVPIAPEWALQGISILSLTTALYASCMTLVQDTARRFFCYLFLSHASLVFVGLETTTAIGLAGALSLWMSVSIALSGLGLTLRCIESRTGPISLKEYHGYASTMPGFAGLFLLTGLSCVGFPCTIGFIGSELLIESAIEFSPWVGFVVVVSTALNGMAIMRAYFRIFTGAVHRSSVPLVPMRSERIAILMLTILLIGGGLVPQLIVHSRFNAAKEILQHRKL
jgi:NADH-quinone oxidoreductase subunit M